MTYNDKYQKENIRNVRFKLNRQTDAALIEWIDQQENINGYLKELVKEDIERHNEDGQ